MKTTAIANLKCLLLKATTKECFEERWGFENCLDLFKLNGHLELLLSNCDDNITKKLIREYA